MIRILAFIFGLAFIFAGIVGYGYLPQFMQDGLLFGYFHIDSMHSNIHIGTGVIAILCASSAGLSRIFFILIGLIYAAVAGLGFYQNGDLVIMQVSQADNFLHTGIAAVALMLGLASKA